MIAPTLFAISIAGKVALGAGLLGAAAGVIGAFAVLKRRSLVGDMIAHASLPGVCLAFLLAGRRDSDALTLGALLAGMLGVGCVALVTRWTRTKDDAAVSLVLSVFFGAGVVLLTYLQNHSTGGQAGLDSYLFGEIASLQSRDVRRLAIVLALVLLGVTLAFKELRLATFDEEFARAQGWPTLAIDFAVLGAIALVTVVGLPLCGVVLVAAMLIYPCAAARCWSNKLAVVLVIAALIGALAASGGVLLASFPALGGTIGEWSAWFVGSTPPPGPMIVLTGALLFGLSLCFAPEQGLLAKVLRDAKLRQVIGRDHLLRSLYEQTEPQLAARPIVDTSKLTENFRGRSAQLRRLLSEAEREEWIERSGAGVRFTPAGLERATQVVRAHRIWELYLVHYVDIPADHVDGGADDIEHLLPPELVTRLETELATAGRLPPTLKSVHSL
jgi:manganese/zinc/iron transport system permease protein